MSKKYSLVSIILLGFIFGIGSPLFFQQQKVVGETNPAYITELNQTTQVPTSSIVWEMLGQVNEERALVDLRKLSGEEPICLDSTCYTIANRLTGSEGLQWAKDYIDHELNSLGYIVEYLDWSQSVYADQDIIVRKPGLISPEEEIYFVAHLDGVKTSSAEDFPDADDNASGAVDILELARTLNSFSFKRTLVLLFSTGEEQGTLGVQSYLSQLLPGELNAIKNVVNIDMIGYDANSDGVMEIWHGGHALSIELAQMLAEIIDAYQFNLAPTLVIGCG